MTMQYFMSKKLIINNLMKLIKIKINNNNNNNNNILIKNNNKKLKILNHFTHIKSLVPCIQKTIKIKLTDHEVLKILLIRIKVHNMVNFINHRK